MRDRPAGGLGRDESALGPKATKSNGPYHQSVMHWSATNPNVHPNAPPQILGIHQPWRRKRDSNPRASHPANGFQDRRFQPLTHSSSSHRIRFHPFESTVTTWFCAVSAGLSPLWHYLVLRGF